MTYTKSWSQQRLKYMEAQQQMNWLSRSMLDAIFNKYNKKGDCKMSEVKKYRCKITGRVMEVIQWTGSNLREVADFIGNDMPVGQAWACYECKVAREGFKLPISPISRLTVPIGEYISRVEGQNYDVYDKINLERGYELVLDTFCFGCALNHLKAGRKVARKGWNGKGMFLWLKPAVEVRSAWCKDPVLKSLADDNGGTISALGTICMFTHDSTGRKAILTGWLASQTDMLLEDWVLVE